MIQIDMEMPKNCKFCPLHDVNPDQCPIRTIYKDDYATSRFTDCPLYKIAEDTDTISRQAVIDAIVAQTIGYTVDEIKAECEENIFNENGYLGGLKDAIEAIEDMPSAQPEREKGHWIDKTDPDWDGEWDDWQCSCCGSLITSMARNLNGLYLYCPKCGARMEETNEDD